MRGLDCKVVVRKLPSLFSGGSEGDLAQAEGIQRGFCEPKSSTRADGIAAGSCRVWMIVYAVGKDPFLWGIAVLPLRGRPLSLAWLSLHPTIPP